MNLKALFKKEEELQNSISIYLERHRSLSSLIDTENLDNYKCQHNLKNLINSKIITSFEESLRSLDTVSVISEDSNISKLQGEILRPDFILHDTDNERFVVLELKNRAPATREGGTEILAYGQIIKRDFPRIPETDIVYVFISSHWPSLLLNFIFNEIYSSKKNVLCLEPSSISNTSKLEYNQYIKEKNGTCWNLKCIDPKILQKDQCFHLTIDDFSARNYYFKCFKDKCRPFSIVESALKRITRKANETKSDGFCLISTRKQGTNDRYTITYVAVNSNNYLLKSGEKTIYTDMLNSSSHIDEFDEVPTVSAGPKHDFDDLGFSLTSVKNLHEADYFAKPFSCGSTSEDTDGFQIIYDQMIENEFVPKKFEPFGSIADEYESYLLNEFQKAKNQINKMYDYSYFLSYNNAVYGLKFLKEKYKLILKN